MQITYNKSRRATYNLTVHIIFITKYRNPCLTNAMLDDLKVFLEQVLGHWDAKLIEFNGELDHIHCLASYPPHKLLSSIISNMKSTSCKRLWNKYEAELKKHYWKKRVLWTPSYFVASCGGVTIEQLKQYVENQERPTI